MSSRRNGVRGLVLGLVFFCVPSIACAEGEQDIGPSSAPPGPAVGGESPEVEEAIRVLIEAGVPPTREELARFREAARRADPSANVPSNSFSIRGSVKYRLGYFQDEGADHYGKLVLETRWLRARARLREYRTGLRETTGILEIGSEAVELRVGEVGMSQGHGLLVGPPGRGSSLAADTGLISSVGRLVSWLGAPAGGAVSGYGGRAGLGSWRLRFITGQENQAGGGSSHSTRVIQMASVHESWNVSAAHLMRDQESGASLAGRLRTTPLSGSFEILAWRPEFAKPVTTAGILQIGWHPAKGSGLECILGYADLAASPGLARRPAVLSGWSGRGLALRGFTRLDSGLMLRALIHRGQNLDRIGVRCRKDKVLVDLQVGKRLSPLMEAAVRYRSTSSSSWNWSVQFPWQPPRVASSQLRTILSAHIALERLTWRGRLLVRSFGQDSDAVSERRSLISLTGARIFHADWRLRGSWVTAWGEPVDLVSAVCPLTGMVLPRHWGRWRSETVLGFEWRKGGARFQGAGSWRFPVPGEGVGSVQTIWLEAGLVW